MNTDNDKKIKELIDRGDPNLTREQFIEIGNYLFGGDRWGSKAAEIMGCSAANVSHIKRGQTPPARHYMARLLKYAKTHGDRLVKDRIAAEEAQAPKDSLIDEDLNPEKTDDEIAEEQKRQAHNTTEMIKLVLQGLLPSLVVSGNGGSGKSTCVHKARQSLDISDNGYLFSGEMTPPGVFRSLWKTRLPGQYAIFDDCDDVVKDEGSLNQLKSALDSTDRRIISYEKPGANWLKEEAIDPSFEYQGSCIFVTNLDLRAMAKGKSALAVHIDALMSRSLYADMTIRTTREMSIKIKTLLREGMLNTIPNPGNHPPFTQEQINEIENFVVQNRNRFHQYSLRTAVNVGHLVRANPTGWKEMAEWGLMKK